MPRPDPEDTDSEAGNLPAGAPPRRVRPLYPTAGEPQLGGRAPRGRGALRARQDPRQGRDGRGVPLPRRAHRARGRDEGDRSRSTGRRHARAPASSARPACRGSSSTPRSCPSTTSASTSDGADFFTMKCLRGMTLERGPARASPRGDAGVVRRVPAAAPPRRVLGGLPGRRLRPLARRRPPRPQAGQRDARQLRRGVRARLGHRQAGARRAAVAHGRQISTEDARRRCATADRARSSAPGGTWRRSRRAGASTRSTRAATCTRWAPCSSRSSRSSRSTRRRRGRRCSSPPCKGVSARPSERTPHRDVPPELEEICVKATGPRPGQSLPDRARAARRGGALPGGRPRRGACAARWPRRTRARPARARGADAGAADEDARGRRAAEVGRALALEPDNAAALRVLAADRSPRPPATSPPRSPPSSRRTPRAAPPRPAPRGHPRRPRRRLPADPGAPLDGRAQRPAPRRVPSRSPSRPQGRSSWRRRQRRSRAHATAWRSEPTSSTCSRCSAIGRGLRAAVLHADAPTAFTFALLHDVQGGLPRRVIVTGAAGLLGSVGADVLRAVLPGRTLSTTAP